MIEAKVILDSVSPAGKRVCSKCGQPKAFSAFQHYNGRPSGQCRECKTLGMAAKRRAAGATPRQFALIRDGRKTCGQCREHKPLSEFSPSKRGSGGVASFCKKCFSKRYANRETGREATRRYRELNREAYLAGHRLAQFNRKNGINAVSDGTVTKKFLTALYATAICHYCGQETARDQRTADHKHALSKGGGHSASNLVMACFSCNSSKRDGDYEAFKGKKHGD